jgi:hypothetical protein
MRGDTKETFPVWFEDESYIDDERVGSVAAFAASLDFIGAPLRRSTDDRNGPRT